MAACFYAGETTGRTRSIARLLAGLAVFILLVARPDAAMAQDPVDVALPEVSGESGETVLVPVEVSDLSGREVIAFGFTVSYDPEVVDLVGAVSEGTLSSEMLVEANSPEPGRLKVGAAASNALSGEGTLVYLEAEMVAAGQSALAWLSFEFNDGDPPVQLTDGSLQAGNVNEEQRPVPAGDPPPLLLEDLGTELNFFNVGAAAMVFVRQFGFAPGGDAPEGFEIIGETFWNIELSGTNQFGVDACFALASLSGDPVPRALQVLKRPSSADAWQEVPSELRPDVQQPTQICATGVTSLSDFAVAASLAPVFTSTPVTEAAEDAEYVYTAEAVDGQHDAVTLSAVTIPAWLGFTDHGDGMGTLAGTPAGNEVGEHEVVVEASDGTETTSQSFIIMVADVNDAPTVAAALEDRSRALADGAFDVDLSSVFSDADGDALTYKATSSDEAVATADVTASTLTLTPVAEGTATVEVTAADGRGGSATDAFELQVTTANAPPVASDDEATMDEDAAVAIDVLTNDSDSDGDALTVSQVGDPGNGSASIDEDGTIRYNPTEDFDGSDTFTYTVSDGRGGSDQATVNVTVQPVNDAPVFPKEPVFTTPEADAEIVIEGDPDTPLEVIWRTAEDPEGDSLTYEWQLALTDDFSTPLVEAPAQEETRLQMTYGTLAARLTEHGVEAGERTDIYHRVWATDGDLTTTSQAAHFFVTRGVLTAMEHDDVPEAFSLAQNYPNPFNPQTTIRYELPRAAEVTLSVYDALGREVATLVEARQPAGRYETSFDARSLPSGIYLYRLEADDHSAVRRMVLAK